MARVWLGLGSNSGDSLKILARAIDDLEREVLASCSISRVWISQARYFVDQADFFNMAISGTSNAGPYDILAQIHSIEARYGRDRTQEIAKGPRTLDIDILLYDNKITTNQDLIIPHPGLVERKFALLPLLELDFNLVHPVLGLSLRHLAAALPPQGIYPLSDSRYDRFYTE